MKKKPLGALGAGGGRRRSAAAAEVEKVSRHSATQTTDFFSMRTLPSLVPIERGDDFRRTTGTNRKEPVCTHLHLRCRLSESQATRLRIGHSSVRPRQESPDSESGAFFKTAAADSTGVWRKCCSVDYDV